MDKCQMFDVGEIAQERVGRVVSIEFGLFKRPQRSFFVERRDATLESGKADLIDQYSIKLLNENSVIAARDKWHESVALNLHGIDYDTAHLANHSIDELDA